MNKLEIEYKGGFRLVSKVLTHKHGANFAIIVDALVYIYNENLDNLIKIEDQYAVKISNGFLSRQTGLSMDITKRQVTKIESLGLIIAIKKGQGNTRHYVINADGIDKYIEGLKVEFDEWFEKSLDSSKKDKARSKEADRIKIEIGLEALNKTMEFMNLDGAIPTKELVQNLSTQLCDIHQPKWVKPVVADTEEETDKETDKETTTEPNTIVDVDPVFSNKDDTGLFIEKFHKKVYKRDYESYVKNYSDNDLDDMSSSLSEDIILEGDILILDEDDTEMKCIEYKDEEIYLYIYNEFKALKRVEERKKKKERETTKIPANKDTSDSNWEKLRKTYDDLPEINNQGKFYVSKKDKHNFYSLSEFRQEYVISSVTTMQDSTSTASRPAFYMAEAMKDKLKEVYDPNFTLSVTY